MKKVHRVILISGSIVIIGLLIFGIFLFINKKQNKLESPINDNVALLAEIGNDKETESDNYAAVSDETEKADDTSPEHAKDKTSDGYEIEDDVNIISSEAPVKKTIDGGEIPSSKNSDNYSDIQSDNNSKEQEKKSEIKEKEKPEEKNKNNTRENKQEENKNNEEDNSEAKKPEDTYQQPQRELEPLADIGTNYIKDPAEGDLIYDAETEMTFVKNQLIIDAYIGTPKEAIEEIVKENDAIIVGYIELINFYQIEFNKDKTYEELMNTAAYLEGFPCIKMAELNYISEIGVNYFTNDELYNDSAICVDREYELKKNVVIPYIVKISEIDDGLDENEPTGDNWNLKKLHILSAWNHTTGSSPVKVGIYDNYFEDTREDGELIFDDIIGYNSSFDPQGYGTIEHGTHVSGIIGATPNNNRGIAGVANNVKLYGCSYLMGDHIFTFARDISNYTKLIGNHIRIINVSTGYEDNGVICSASEGNTIQRCGIKNTSTILENALNDLLDLGYDFLIVSAAGNSNGYKYRKLGDTKYIEVGENDPNGMPMTTIDARYSSDLNAIEDERVRNRIIVVGSMGQGSKLELSNFSNVGDRVDVCAPGDKILSTIPKGMDYDIIEDTVLKGYGIMKGTSMAAPHISGIAALMLQVNPSLSAIQTKRIICDDRNAGGKYTDSLNYSHNMPNAELCVLDAINTNASLKNWNEGAVAGAVKENNSELGLSAKIYATRKNTGDYAIGTYNYSFESDSDGVFSYMLPTGQYDLLITSDGYLPAVIKDVEINAEETNNINVSLVKWQQGLGYSGGLNGIIIDAISGEPIDGATVKVRKGWNNYSGDCTKDEALDEEKVESNQDGIFGMVLPIGNYTIEIIKDNYIIGYFNGVSTFPNGEGVNGFLTYALSPVLPENEYRIILTWDDSPQDLDSHLTYYINGEQQFHVYYSNRTGYYNGEAVATLDLDDTNGYGPETVTITVNAEQIGDGEFRYSVHNYSNESPISQSDAVVRIYKGNTLIQDPIQAPNDISDKVWYVFSITKDGIIMKNESYNASSSSVQ